MILQTTIRVNNGEPVRGEFTAEQNVEWVESWSATKPDMRWTFVDKAGHFHAYDHEGNLPTLRTETKHKNCDGSCGGVCGGEGYDVTVYRCLACNKKVQPERVPEGAVAIPGPRTFTLTVYGDVPAGLFSFTADVNRQQFFGFAERFEGSAVRSVAGAVEVTSVCNAHPVSWRKITEAANVQ